MSLVTWSLLASPAEGAAALRAPCKAVPGAVPAAERARALRPCALPARVTRPHGIRRAQRERETQVPREVGVWSLGVGSVKNNTSARELLVYAFAA